MLARITAVLERARVAGGWIDEDVAAAVLAEMREPTDAMIEAIANGIYDDDCSSTIWEHAIGAATDVDLIPIIRDGRTVGFLDVSPPRYAGPAGMNPTPGGIAFIE